MENLPNTPNPYNPTPVPEQPKKSYFQRNAVGIIGFILVVFGSICFKFSWLEFLKSVWAPMLLVGGVMCLIGLFRRPRLLPSLGCLISLGWILLFVIIALAAGQWKAPERPDEDEIDTTVVVPDSTDSIEISSPDTYVP